jgi:diguanylate cyclase (GGDEF)-like protein
VASSPAGLRGREAALNHYVEWTSRGTLLLAHNGRAASAAVRDGGAAMGGNERGRPDDAGIVRAPEQHAFHVGESATEPDPAPSDPERSATEADQSGSDADQTASDADQTASDADQTAEERDEADAASDQRAAEADQAAADERLPADAEGAKREAYEASRATRAASKAHRLATRAARTRSSGSRLGTGVERDATAAARDETARSRDRAESLGRSVAGPAAHVAEKTVGEDAFDTIEEAVARAREQIRARADADRLRAAADRERAAQDRAEAALERRRLEAELDHAHLDDLTGAFRREMGRLALSHEIDHARRGDGRFVIAFVDVDGMKRVNDRDGHAAGDQVLQTLVAAMRSNLRSFDPVVRYGGDEFVCGLGGADLDEVERRFSLIRRTLQDDVGVGISVGLAALGADETLDELTARADAALLEAKKGIRE